MSDSHDSLYARLNGETGKLSWKELERHFARGVVIWVSPDLDLVDVAARFAGDDKGAVERWLTDGRVGRPSSDQAEAWHNKQPGFWAVVAAPWVLVQEICEPEATLH